MLSEQKRKRKKRGREALVFGRLRIAGHKLLAAEQANGIVEIRDAVLGGKAKMV